MGLQLLRGRLEGLRAVVGLLLEGHLGVGEDCRQDRAWRELRRVLHPEGASRDRPWVPQGKVSSLPA